MTEQGIAVSVHFSHACFASEAFRVLKPGGRTVFVATDGMPSSGILKTLNGWPGP